MKYRQANISGKRRTKQTRGLSKGLYETYINNENSLLNQLKRQLETLIVQGAPENEVLFVKTRIVNLTT